MELSNKAKQAKREYKKQWRDKNREKCNEYHRKWNHENPAKIREYQRRYWERKAEQPDISQQVINLRTEGKSYREIGEALNISHMKAKRIIEGVTTL